MVNELYSLANALHDANIVPVEWNRKLKELRKVSSKAPCFRIWLSADLSVHGVDEIIEQERVAALRKWEPNLGNSFPAFNMPSLYRFSQDQSQKINDWVEGKAPVDLQLLQAWCVADTCNWTKKDKAGTNALAKMEACLHAVPAQLEQCLSNSTGDEKAVVVSLLQRVSKLAVLAFRDALVQYIFSNRGNIKTSLKLLSGDTQVFLDVDEDEAYSVAHEKTILWLNSALNSADSDSVDATSATSKDAFGIPYNSVNEPMPSVKLAGKVGDVKLRALFHEHQCQFRYGMIDDASYPIGKKNRMKAKQALEWLKDSEREGKTWGMVDLEEILFVYPSTIQAASGKFASLLGTAGAVSPEKFEDISSNVVSTLQGLPYAGAHESIQVFAIRKMDKARSKVVFYRNYTMDHLVASAERWQKGCKNLPFTTCRVWPEKVPGPQQGSEKQKPEYVEPETPKPLQVARIVNRAWKIDGTLAGEVKRMKYYQGIELLLDPLNTQMEAYILHVLLSNATGLILYVGDTLHRGNVLPNKIFHENCVFLLPILALLLYNRNCKKEEYVENTPYLIGQILKISDELHALYCKVVRNGAVPPQLAGGSLFVTASETPIQALSQLRLRVAPYISWAKQYRTKNGADKGTESWRANWYLHLYEGAMTKLSHQLIEPVRFDDLAKAQVFIGYLAAFPKRDTDTTTSTQSDEFKGEIHE
jgi:hypothetical protein